MFSLTQKKRKTKDLNITVDAKSVMKSIQVVIGASHATRADFRKNFDKWTSGNKEIDYFIQNTQIHAWNQFLVLEWYPWENFSDIEEIDQGGYGTVFRAKTKLGRIRYWNHENNQWSRYNIDDDEYVALKTKMKALVNISLLFSIVKMEIYVNNYNVNIMKLLGKKRLE